MQTCAAISRASITAAERDRATAAVNNSFKGEASFRAFTYAASRIAAAAGQCTRNRTVAGAAACAMPRLVVAAAMPAAPVGGQRKQEKQPVRCVSRVCEVTAVSGWTCAHRLHCSAAQLALFITCDSTMYQLCVTASAPRHHVLNTSRPNAHQGLTRSLSVLCRAPAAHCRWRSGG
jgi:hypothetical protein